MSRAPKTGTPQRHHGTLVFALWTAGLIAGCSGEREPWMIDPEGYDGVEATTFARLANPCTIDVGATTMSLSVRDGETGYISLRAADNTVIADGETAGGAECAVPASYLIAVTEDGGHAGVEKVLLDYSQGPFALGSTPGGVVTPGVTISLGAGSTLVVLGSSGNDKIYLGSTYAASVLAHSWININGDTSPDVRIDGITDIKVSTGPGADIISADGGNGTTGVVLDATIVFSAYGGPDADVLTGGKGPNTLVGGDGDDRFIQTATIAADNVVGGRGKDTVDYSARLTAVNVTVCTTCAADPCGCIATDTSCRVAADTARTACGADATAALATCNTAADDAHATCVTSCTADAVCIAACDATQMSDLAACTATSTSALAICTADQTAGYATCDAAESACQASCTATACAVCVGDDGAVGEGDTINDDVEIVLGGKGNDTLSARVAVCSDAAATPTVLCTLKGNAGDDTLIGSAHQDLIDGGAGNDTLIGGLGDDTLIGGAGVDTVSYADRSNAVKVSLDAAHLWIAGQNGVAGELDSIASDIENLTGGSGDDLLRGSAAANIIHGGAGDDTIEGGAGNDSLYGDAGNDLIYGGAGNDMLVGGAGADTMVGGDGDDFIDAADSPASADVSIDCDGVNDVGNTAGTSPGTSDALVKDASDTGAMHCEL